MFVSHGLTMVPAQMGWYVVRPIYSVSGSVDSIIEYEIIAWATLMEKINNELPLSPTNLSTEVLPVTYMESDHSPNEVIRQPNGTYVLQDSQYFLNVRDVTAYFESIYEA